MEYPKMFKFKPPFVAGGVGVEPTQMVLETIVLPLYEPPTKKGGLYQDPSHGNRYWNIYLVSLCKVFFLQNLQNFWSSRRLAVFFLFLLVW